MTCGEMSIGHIVVPLVNVASDTPSPSQLSGQGGDEIFCARSMIQLFERYLLEHNGSR